MFTGSHQRRCCQDFCGVSEGREPPRAPIWSCVGTIQWCESILKTILKRLIMAVQWSWCIVCSSIKLLVIPKYFCYVSTGTHQHCFWNVWADSSCRRQSGIAHFRNASSIPQRRCSRAGSLGSRQHCWWQSAIPWPSFARQWSRSFGRSTFSRMNDFNFNFDFSQMINNLFQYLI